MHFMPNNTMVFVYKLPLRPEMAKGQCFGGGHPVTFQNVDWFNGFEGMTREFLENEVRGKQYIRPGESYLVCSPDNDISFTFKIPPTPNTRKEA